MKNKTGILFIILGIIFISIRILDGDKVWTMIDYLKVVVGIALIIVGILQIVKARRTEPKVKS